MTDNALIVDDLSVTVRTEHGEKTLIHHISFSVAPGETLALIGESGGGKSTTAYAIMGLLDKKEGFTVSGKITIHGGKAAIIFQDPSSALHPLLSIGEQIKETLLVHKNMTEEAAVEEANTLLRVVGLDRGDASFTTYPHELSGGMKQRVMIAIALCMQPSVLIADEPTTSLDVLIQQEIFALLEKIQKEYQTAILLITHDASIVAKRADRIAVLYHGKIVEYTDKYSLFLSPKHPYTQGLLACIPKIAFRQKKLPTIQGIMPSPEDTIQGCAFHPRCPYVMEKCLSQKMRMQEVPGYGSVACWLYEQKD